MEKKILGKKIIAMFMVVLLLTNIFMTVLMPVSEGATHPKFECSSPEARDKLVQIIQSKAMGLYVKAVRRERN